MSKDENQKPDKPSASNSKSEIDNLIDSVIERSGSFPDLPNSEAVDAFSEARKAERAAELRKLKTREKPSTKAVEDMLRDKGVATETDFTAAGNKEAGISAGYIAKENDTGNTFILKQFYKTTEECKTQQDRANRRDGVQELLGSGMYGLLLYDRAPKEELVRPNEKELQKELVRLKEKERLTDEEEKEIEKKLASVYVRSKFFDDAQTLDKFTGFPSTRLNSRSENLKTLEGLEKVVAACQILGELDYHAGNMMVQKQKIQETGKDGKPLENEKGEPVYKTLKDEKGEELKDKAGKPLYETRNVVTKIDHGRSFVEFHQDFKSMINSTQTCFQTFGYSNAINNGNLKFNVNEYSASLKQMVSQLDGNQIENMVDQKIAELKKEGFNPKGLVVASRFDSSAGKGKGYKGTEINNFEDLRKVYVETAKQNLENMKEISKNVEIITKLDGQTEEFKNGKWLEKFAESKCKDPIEYAVKNNITIDKGKDPVEWKKEYDAKQLSEPKDKPQDKSADEIKWVQYGDKDKWHDREQLKADGVTDQKLKQDKVKRDDRRVAKLQEIKDAKAQEALKEFREKENLKKDKKHTDAAKAIEPLIDEFVTKPVNKHAVQALYIEVLKAADNHEIMTFNDDGSFVQSKGFEAQVKETTKLLSVKLDGCSKLDKVNYKMGEFCQSIGCTKVSEHFANKVSEKGKETIQALKSNVMKEAIRKFAEGLENEGIKEVAKKLPMKPVQSSKGRY